MADSVDGSPFQRQPQQSYHGQPWDVPAHPRTASPAAATGPHSPGQQQQQEVPFLSFYQLLWIAFCRKNAQVHAAFIILEANMLEHCSLGSIAARAP